VAAADPGDATSDGDIKVIQKNVQVIAGNQSTEENSTQTADNLVLASQTNTAQAGDATATDGGLATSGNATATSRGVVIQLNIQVIAGKDCAVDQTASNVAVLDQNATATSGNATASGSGSNARTGDARATNFAVIKQKNKQIYVCRGNDGGGGSQTASNFGAVGQTAEATTGDASATGGATSSSGDATVNNRQRLNQNNSQSARD
jgi:hypothetical protein